MTSPLIKLSSIPMKSMMGAALILLVAVGSSDAQTALPPVQPQSAAITIALPDEDLDKIGATFVHKVENRRNAGGPPSRNHRRIEIKK